MALSMPSRFAVLKIEDDDFKPVNPNKVKDKNKKKQDKSATASKKTQNTKVQPAKSQAQQKRDKKKREPSNQWEQWKQKDSELVDGNYEQDLHTAILESKLDYEEKKNIYKQNKNEAEQQHKVPENGKKKKNKTTMSLGQFQNPGAYLKKDENEDVREAPEENAQFFERVKSETKQELSKELTKDTKKEKVRKSFNNDTITIAHLQEKVDILEKENSNLKLNLENAKKEIICVKNRNKALYGMLSAGEMKDKADILLELEKHNRIKDELTEEVTRLNGLLEQERSRSKTGNSVTENHQSHNHKHTKEHKEKTRKKDRC